MICTLWGSRHSDNAMEFLNQHLRNRKPHLIPSFSTTQVIQITAPTRWMRK